MLMTPLENIAFVSHSLWIAARFEVWYAQAFFLKTDHEFSNCADPMTNRNPPT